TIASQTTNGTYTIGGNTDNNSTFSGAITLNKPLTVTQVANAGANVLTISGGIANGGNLVTFNNAGNVNLTTAAISGTGGLTKSGSGNLAMSFANTYTGSTTITAGTITLGAANGLATASPVILNGGTLSTGATA